MSYVKCPTCNMTFNRDKEENICLGHRYYHIKCCTDEQIYREKIFVFLDKLWGKCIRNKINLQIAEINQQSQITTKEIYQDLYYFFEILKSDNTKYQNTIKIVPFIHKDSQSYWYHLDKEEERKQQVDNVLTNIDLMEIKIVYGTKTPKKQKVLLQTHTEDNEHLQDT